MKLSGLNIFRECVKKSLKLNPVLVLVLVLKPKALYFFSRIKSRKAWRSSCPF